MAATGQSAAQVMKGSSKVNQRAQEPLEKQDDKRGAAETAAEAKNTGKKDKPMKENIELEKTKDTAEPKSSKLAKKTDKAEKKSAQAVKPAAGKKRSKDEMKSDSAENTTEAPPKKKRAPAKAKAQEATAMEIDAPEETGEVEAEKAESKPTGRLGRSNKAVNYKERSDKIKAEVVAVKEDSQAECEEDAIQALCPEGKLFRLTEFEILGEDDQHQPLDWCTHSKQPLSITGVIHSKDGPLTKGKGKRVAGFGPVKSWSMTEQAGALQIKLRTALAEYICARPSIAYKKVFSHLHEQALIAFEVQRALHSDLGGKITCSVDEVVARLSRAKVGKSYSSAREALILNGNFVIKQLKEYDTCHSTSLSDSPLVVALQVEIDGLHRNGVDKNGGIVINEGQPGKEQNDKLGSAEKRNMQADADFARQLQAQMDVQESRGRNKRGGQSGQAYIKISEAEIADDYPEPLEYEKPSEETDELLLADDEMFDIDPEALPRRLLSDFSIYNSEGMMSTLELLPMWSGAETDTDLFFSGAVKDDDGTWSGGQALGNSTEEEAGGSSSGGSSSGSGDMRIFSSQIQEWIVEFTCDKLFITIRTDVAWYRLASPNAKYAPWFEVVLKSARLAVGTLTMLSNEARPSKLSLNDIVKRLAATPEDDLTFISKKVDRVQRFVVVHGQIILNQFKNFPNKAVRESAFVSSLKTLMEGRKHSKLYVKSSGKASNKLRSASNPMRDRASAKAAPMTATATAMVRSIWQSYFPASEDAQPGAEDGKPEAKAAVELTDDLNEEDEEAEEENALVETATEAPLSAKKAVPKKAVVWDDSTKSSTDASTTMYRSGKIGELEVSVGDVVSLAEESSLRTTLGLVQAFSVVKKKAQMQYRVVLRGSETVLGDAASTDELFLTDQVTSGAVETIESKVDVSILRRGWRLSDRRMHLAEDQARQEFNKTAALEDTPLRHILRTLYLPEQGMFCQLPADLQLGTRLKETVEEPKTGYSADGKTLFKDGAKLAPGDCVFLKPGLLDHAKEEEEAQPAEYAAKGRFVKGGANTGLRAYGIARIITIPAKNEKGNKDKKTINIKVQRFYRPEDISREHALKADFWEIYSSKETLEVDLLDVVSKCEVESSSSTSEGVFKCGKLYDRSTGQFSDSPVIEAGQKKVTGKQVADKGKGAAGKAPAQDKGKGSGKTSAVAAAPDASTAAPSRTSSAVNDGIALASMDIFAGCGGLTEGLHQAGAARAKWAIEYEEPAAQAFRMNHPDAVCWAKNCNVILTAAMNKAGLSDLCMGSKEAEAQAKELATDILEALPAPGEVDFLCGGPPCQGYSGMNRFNKGNWSMVQNSMVMAYLSFADVYRPRYFLLENVRNFVSHNKSFTFRLTLRSLLDMGYQVRFGVLNAGNFGVSQSRKRTFIWAAAPGEALPDWPSLLHVFRSPQLTINLPGGAKYCAVPQTEGAPLRAVTVRDVISDLPEIKNGHGTTEMQYSGPAVSAFQRKIRGSETVLKDHICKEMNALNLERCRCVPKNQPGADWRVLQQIVEQDPSREMFQGQALVPWCLPNTADRHNGWRGLFGRLDWEGHFPTSTTDPQPMGKVGQVFHPSQDRIVSVRECARAQGFPDSFQFYGNVHNKHRQIGNAVPPPLAYSLGRCLRKALEKTAAERQNALLLAQV